MKRNLPPHRRPQRPTKFTLNTPAWAVFISYASQDAAVANAIVAALEGQGIRCWIAPRDVTPGALYADGIIRAINGAKFLVLVLSANAIVSPHVSKEVERASSKRIPVIALRTDFAPLTPALEYFLSESQWIDQNLVGHEAPARSSKARRLRLNVERTLSASAAARSEGP